jgi:hypothetical protein
VRTAGDTYNVFPNAPDKTPQTALIGPGLGNAESPEGWLVSNTSTTTTGNNVDAYLDRDHNNAPDIGGRPVSATREFLAIANLAQDPTASQNQMVAVTNLFYLRLLTRTARSRVRWAGRRVSRERSELAGRSHEVTSSQARISLRHQSPTQRD